MRGGAWCRVGRRGGGGVTTHLVAGQGCGLGRLAPAVPDSVRRGNQRKGARRLTQTLWSIGIAPVLAVGGGLGLRSACARLPERGIVLTSPGHPPPALESGNASRCESRASMLPLLAFPPSGESRRHPLAGIGATSERGYARVKSSSSTLPVLPHHAGFGSAGRASRSAQAPSSGSLARTLSRDSQTRPPSHRAWRFGGDQGPVRCSACAGRRSRTAASSSRRRGRSGAWSAGMGGLNGPVPSERWAVRSSAHLRRCCCSWEPAGRSGVVSAGGGVGRGLPRRGRPALWRW